MLVPANYGDPTLPAVITGMHDAFDRYLVRALNTPDIFNTLDADSKAEVIWHALKNGTLVADGLYGLSFTLLDPHEAAHDAHGGDENPDRDDCAICIAYVTRYMKWGA